jgi:multidrug efflux pump subunit AcrB
VRFQRGFEARFERFASGYRDLLALALGIARPFRDRLPRLRRAVVPAGAVLGRNFFPSVDAGQILMHVRAQVGTRVEETANQFADREGDPQIIPADEIETLVDNIGLPISGINMTYNNTGVIGPQDGDIQIKLKEGHRPTAEYVAGAARAAAARLSRVDVLVPAGRHRQPDPEFRRAGADRPADRGANLAANFAYANKLLSADRRIPGVADARIQQSPNNPSFNVDVDRTRAQYVG